MKIFLPHKVQINLVALRSSVIIAGHARRILLSIILKINGFDQKHLFNTEALFISLHLSLTTVPSL